MNGQWQSGNKNTIARKLISDALDSLSTIDNLQIALRVYGHQKYYTKGQDCDDTKLEVPFGNNNIQAIRKVLFSIKPKGTTPIARSLEKAGGDFPECDDCRNLIILVTDGIEECDGDPCAISIALQEKGIVLKPFVIGIGLNVEMIEAFKCIGNIYDASNEETFRTVLNVVISQALNNTTAQVNLLDNQGRAMETDVNMTFYDKLTKQMKHNYVHTINDRGVPDTIQIDPIGSYRMVVHTIPQVIKDSIKLIAGTHNIIAVDAPQGNLKLRVEGAFDNKNPIKTIVRKAGKLETLHVQDFNKTEKYIIGKYDLEILTLPRLHIKNIDISQSHTTNIEIPRSGKANLMMRTLGNGSIYEDKENELKWVCNLSTNVTTESVSLLPGSYLAIFRPSKSKQAIFTIEKKFRIKSGGSTSVKLY